MQKQVPRAWAKRMKKVYDAGKVMKSMLTKDEFAFYSRQGWNITPNSCFFETSKSTDRLRVEKACKTRVKSLRQRAQKYFADGKLTEEELMNQIKSENLEFKKRLAKSRRDVAIYKKNLQDIVDKSFLKKRYKHWSPACFLVSSWDFYKLERNLMEDLRFGENIGTFDVKYGKENRVVCVEAADYTNGYSKSCGFTMIRRSFYMTVKRGYTVQVIGGLITFIKGEDMPRTGFACEWVEQGKRIADITLHKGFVVRGEHIEAKTLKEALRLNSEHRAMKLARLLASRKKAERRKEQKKSGTVKITFADSLKAGNCRP